MPLPPNTPHQIGWPLAEIACNSGLSAPWAIVTVAGLSVKSTVIGAGLGAGAGAGVGAGLAATAGAEGWVAGCVGVGDCAVGVLVWVAGAVVTGVFLAARCCAAVAFAKAICWLCACTAVYANAAAMIRATTIGRYTRFIAKSDLTFPNMVV